jgi:hypothetical protein
MFPFAKEPSQLDIALNRAYAALSNLQETDEKYAAILDQIVKLHKMKNDERTLQVSPDTWATIGANLAGILLIIRHEHVNVITSRAMNLVTKLK